MPQAAARYARGLQRRDALVAAAADVVLEQGLAALSHRAVAARAGLPLASTTYYFTSLDQLREQALSLVAEGAIARSVTALEELPRPCRPADAAAAIATMVGADAPPGQLTVLYERYLEAGRHDRLRPLVSAWNARLRQVVSQALDRASLPSGAADTGMVLAVADGAAITALAEGEPTLEAVTGALTRTLELLGAQPRLPAS